MAYLDEPESMLLVVREDKKVCCLSFNRESRVQGWSLWDIPAVDVCSVPGSDGDEAWLLVDRSGTYIWERIKWGSVGLDGWVNTPSGGTIIAGASYYNGSVVTVVGDGAYLGTVPISGGQGVLPEPANEVYV